MGGVEGRGDGMGGVEGDRGGGGGESVELLDEVVFHESGAPFEGFEEVGCFGRESGLWERGHGFVEAIA